MSLIADIAAVQLIGTGAMNYAGMLITAAGVAPIGKGTVTALDCAKSLVDSNDPPADVTEALKYLQTAAVLFVTQFVAAGPQNETAILTPLEDDLVAALDRQPLSTHTSETTIPARALAERALDYARQIITAEDENISIGSDPVEHATVDLHIAAVAFTTQLAIREGGDSKKLSWLAKRLITRLKRGRS